MGTICILLGCIIFCVFALIGCAGGVGLANLICNTMVAYSHYRTAITAGIIAFFVIIGLLICLNLVMHGLTYNKVSKTYKLLNAMKRKSRKE